MKFKRCLLALSFGLAISGVRAEVQNYKILTKVGDQAISTSDRDLEYFLRNPSKYRGQSKATISKFEADELLNRMIVETMIFEENKVVGRVELAPAVTLGLLKTFRTSLGNRWREFLLDFDVDENSIKERLQKRAVVDRVIQSKIESVLKTPGVTKDQGEMAAQKSVDDWLKQLRVRFRVQDFK